MHPTDATCHAVTSALRNSGFLMIKTPFLPLELQHRALKAASKILEFKSSSMVVTHPKDPKVYAMLHGVSFIGDASVDPVVINDLKEWYHAVRSTKELLLYCIAVGLGMDDNPNFFSKLHNQDNDALRLLQYLPGDKTTGNRCKEHSDYGTITLLLTDGVRGLEAFIDGKWSPVPYEEGAIIVNIGSLLSEWTRQELKATLHRVAGPASKGSSTPTAALLDAVSVPRTSIAYFADPNEDVSVALEDSEKIGVASINGMSVTEYIEWRSGGEGADRSGVAFTSAEELRLKP